MSPTSKFNWQTFFLKWVPTGFGTFITGHFAIAGDRVTEAVISLGATVAYPMFASLVEGFVRGVKKKADEKDRKRNYY